MKLALVEALEAAWELNDNHKLDELLGLIDVLRPGERRPLLEAHAHRFKARRTGDRGEYEATAAKFRELNMAFALAVTQLERAERLVVEARGEEPELLLAQARETFERLRATRWLERVDALDARRAEVPA